MFILFVLEINNDLSEAERRENKEEDKTNNKIDS
jgi:hypothetical protein